MMPTQSQLRHIERREWFIWLFSLLIIFGLTWAVATFSYRSFYTTADAFYIFQLQQTVWALVALVLLFAIYTLRLQLQLHDMRRRLTATSENRGAEQSSQMPSKE